MSMIGFASRCGTAVEPWCSMRCASFPSTRAMRSRSASNARAQRGLYDEICSGCCIIAAEELALECRLLFPPHIGDVGHADDGDDENRKQITCEYVVAVRA